ncbi:MAG: translation initiation factor IF-2 [Cyanobacteria bacterium P01_F01_bin.150]
MNSGKVRIYELSKELDLENRDILAVCDQLNISVKSHSSTITEDDAERIRAVAENYVPARAPAKKARTPNRGKPSSPKAPIKKKQQILEIRKKSPGSNGKASPELVSKPKLARPEVASPLEPGLKSPAPLRPEPQEKPELAVEQKSEQSLVPDTVSSPPASKPVVAPEPVAKPQLINPPMRPSRKAPMSPDNGGGSRADASPAPVRNRPILKKSSEKGDRSPSPSRKAVPSPSAPRKVAKDGARSGVRDDDRDGSSSPTRPARKNESKSTPARSGHPAAAELKRPVNRPVKPKQLAEEEAVDVDEIDSSDEAMEEVTMVADPFELRRPTPPRPKREKVRSEDEDDEESLASKKAKATKGKRRPQPVVLDDDDFDDDDDANNLNEVTAQQVSLSLMRPPKPKSASSDAARPSTARRKRSPSRGGSNRGQRRDRRAKEPARERPEILELSASIAVHDLAEQLVVPETDIIKSLFFKGIAANINQILDIPTATMVAEEFGVLVEAVEADAEAKKLTEMLEEDDLENLERRPPVVTIMGHVDHGKTTLLDSIRQAKVAQGEAGGITQHIGAYHVDVDHNGEKQQVVFLDTPGHEAFTAMRARGARVTDIAVLVVAADDGVRPQTIEAIKHAQAAEVPIVVAINKTDKEEAQPDRVKQELTEHQLVPEEWGGDTIMVPVSALNGQNLDTLLEMLLLVSEVEDLHANPERPARGTVIEAHLDKARGPVATLLIQNGTLKVGDTLVAGSVFGKVRAMIDDQGKRVSAATPSFAAEVLGLGDVPAAGDEFEVFREEKEARSVADSRSDEQRLSRLQQAMASRRVSLNTISAQAQEGELKELNLILKADVQGSVEAILASLQQLPQKEVQVRVLLAAPGEVTETDVDLAAASGAVIIGFNTTLASGARQAADRADVDIREYDIIYKLLEDIQGAMEGLLEPELVEESLGQAEVRAVFPVGRGAVAGCYIQSGKVIRNCNVRVHRNGELVFTGNLDSLKRMKEDAKEVNSGFECGVGIDNFNSWEEQDVIEAYKMVTRRRTLTV